MQEEKYDYTQFTSLFSDGKLALTEQISISSDAMHYLEKMDGAITGGIAVLPGGFSVVCNNRDQALAAPMVWVCVDGRGTLFTHPFEFTLVPFAETVKRLDADFEAFKLFHIQMEWNYMSLQRNLSAWGRVNGAVVAEFRVWLAKYYPAEEHDQKLQAVLLYCRLAEQSGFVTQENLGEIVEAAKKPMAKKRRRAMRKGN